MKISKVLPAIILFAFFSSVLHAQLKFTMPKYKGVLELKDRQPIVIVNPPNPDMVAKLAKRGANDALDKYQNVISNYNTAMKNAVTKFWTFNSLPILYKTRAELKDMYRDKSQRDKYVLIGCCSSEIYSRDLDWNMDKDGTELIGQITLFIISPNLDDSPVYELPFDVLTPSPVTLSYYVSKANFIFNYLINKQKDCKMPEMINENAHLLSQKTLLIVSGEVNKDCINNIKTYYPCNFKLVDSTEMEKAVLSGDPAYAYIIITGWTSSLVYMDWVVNCQDGAILGYSDFGKPAAFKIVRGFNKDFFQDIAQFCSGTMKK